MSARDGRELFFLQGRQLMATLVQTDGSFTRGTPELLFQVQANYGLGDVAPDGRFLMIIPAGRTAAETDAPPPHINVVLNWHEELKARVPID